MNRAFCCAACGERFVWFMPVEGGFVLLCGACAAVLARVRCEGAVPERRAP